MLIRSLLQAKFSLTKEIKSLKFNALCRKIAIFLTWVSMKIEKLRLPECHLGTDLVVVIDVIRAFTTAACAFAKGAKKIIIVGSVEEAFLTQKLFRDSLLMGEVGGSPIEGFDLSNSPVEILQKDLSGKTLIQRTSSGTQGVVGAIHATNILVSSFVVAESTLRRIRELDPQKVSFVITGPAKGGHEDLALADYLEKRLLGEEVKADAYLHEVLNSPYAQEFLSGEHDYLPKKDLDVVCDIDRFGFAMQVFEEEGQLVLRPVSSQN